MEDSQGFNINIIGNRFENGRIGLAIRGWNYTIKDNLLINVPTGVIFYKLRYATLENNYFDNSAFSTFPYNIGDNTIRDWHIESNIFDGEFYLDGTTIVNSITSNTFTGKGKITIKC